MTNQKDYLNGDHSFKMWFKIMWKNGFIFLFLVAFTFFVLQLINWNWMISTIAETFADETLGGIASVIGCLIPVTMCLMIGYKAFYQYWDDLKKGNSR